MKNTFSGINGVSADLLKAVAQVAVDARKQAAESAQTEKAALASRFESFRPTAADKIEREARPIERLYAGMAPAKTEVQKEETIAERVAALKAPKVVTKHQPMSHDSYLLEPKIKLEPKAKRTMEAEGVELSDEDRAFLASVEEQTTPKTEREKDLAAKAHPKDKITHKDVLVARGVVTKEEKEESAAEEKAEKKSNNPFDWKNYKSTIAKKPGEGTGHESKKVSTGMVYTKKEVKEDAEVAEERDTPGQEHVCAVHVKHAKLGEGKTLFSQHADPAEDGSIAWYDVMFSEGIVRVDTTELEIVVAESHMNHKKKKA